MAASTSSSSSSSSSSIGASKTDEVVSQFENKDFYDVLGLKKDASLKDIQRAYRVMALKVHPDRNAGNPTSQRDFQVLGRIISILSDPIKRQRYDKFGDVDK